MSKVLVSKEKLDTLSETIKTKTNKINNLTIDEMTEAVDGISLDGVAVNGLIQQCIVEEGNDISAGDFIEWYNKVYKSLYTYGGRSISNCVLLGNNKVFMAHHNNYYELYGMIVTIDGTTITNQSARLGSVYSYSNINCILLEENKIFIVYSDSTKSLSGMIVTIDGTTMTVASSTQLNSDQYSNNACARCILLEENKIFIAHSYGSNYYLSGMIVTIDGTTMTVASSTQLNSDSGSCYYDVDCILLEENKIFIAHGYNSGHRYLYGTIVTIDGTTMTASSKKLSNYDNGGTKPYTINCILLEENKIFIAHAQSARLCGTIVTIDGTTMTVASSTQLNSDSGSCYGNCRMILLGENKIAIYHGYATSCYLYETTVIIDGTTMTASSKQIYSENYTGENSSVIKLGSMILLLHTWTSSYHIYGTLIHDNIVKPYTTKINGVAKGTGTSGDVIDVYTVNL